MTVEALQGLTLPELIDQLADVSVPEPISYTPETAGWWVFAVLLALGLAVTAIVFMRRRRRNQYRRLALAELQDIEARSFDESALHEVATLVRRTALAIYPRPEVAHLYGDDWREFLNQSAGRDLGPGVDGIVKGPYQPENEEQNIAESITAAKRWIETHHA